MAYTGTVFAPTPSGVGYVNPYTNTVQSTPNNIGPLQTYQNRDNVLGATTGSGVSGGSGGGGNGGSGEIKTPTPGSISAEDAQVNSAYDSAMSYLDQAQRTIESLQPQLQQNVNTTVDTNTQLANTQKAQGQRSLESSASDVQSKYKNAITAARQALQETLMGGRQRFGGGSGIYGALGEYAGSKFQQAQGSAYDTAQKAQSNITELGQQLEESYKNTLAQIGQWKSEQMLAIQQNFTDKLLQINSDRSTAAQNKSIQKIQLLQDMRARADAINNQAYTFQQNLALQKAALGQQIGTQASAYSAAAQTGGLNASNAASTGYDKAVQSGLVNVQGATPTASTGLQTGQVTQKRSVIDPITGLPSFTY